ncbi:hypothetical protein GCM10010211_08600 [Streptomyces albospinus]|uniref:SCO6045-like C-terminal domain-containing protein n=1 Tax=Streptomyces albospinus TaxID=285515 RepID=A0ABQ2URJ6_9ACTN|nr:hypothetical protein GCM10010211_08600 [Streptomyces albospinus]
MRRRLEPVRGNEDPEREGQVPEREGQVPVPEGQVPVPGGRVPERAGDGIVPADERDTLGRDEAATPDVPSPGAIRPQPSPGAGGAERRPASSTDAARERLALAQTALLSALVAGTPAPEGFDRGRLRVQSRALTAKRAAVVAKVAPELPEILGDSYRPAFLGYARHRPLRGGYRQDALDFAAYLLAQDRPEDPAARQQLTRWWRDRAGPRPPSAHPAARLARALRRTLHRR